jgi:hypothetical protein
MGSLAAMTDQKFDEIVVGLGKKLDKNTAILTHKLYRSPYKAPRSIHKRRQLYFKKAKVAG